MELLDFAGEMLEAVALAEKPDAEFVPGDHCRWCRAAGKPCPALRQKIMEVTQMEFSPVESDPTKLADALDWVERIVEPAIKAIRDFAYNELMAGRSVPRWKLVAKQANRQWAYDEAKTIETILDKVSLPEGSKARMYAPKVLLSPAQMEKFVGAAVWKAQKLDVALTKKESSGYTMAPESDKRQAYLPAKPEDEFSPVK
jgi:hypothetical protein